RSDSLCRSLRLALSMMARRNTVCAVGPRCSHPSACAICRLVAPVASGYERGRAGATSQRESRAGLGTTIALRVRAAFRRALLGNRRSTALALAKLDAPDLPGQRLGEVGHELDEPRIG